MPTAVRLDSLDPFGRRDACPNFETLQRRQSLGANALQGHASLCTTRPRLSDLTRLDVCAEDAYDPLPTEDASCTLDSTQAVVELPFLAAGKWALTLRVMNAPKQGTAEGRISGGRFPHAAEFTADVWILQTTVRIAGH